MRGKLWAAVIVAASVGSAVQAQQGYPGGYGGLGAYGGYGWNFGPSLNGMGYGFNSNAYGPYTNTGPFAPNQFNRTSQPLSPYLNLQRNSNPAVNYYYRVRPGTTQNNMGSMGPSNMGMGGMRQPFFPQQFDRDPLADDDSPGRLLPPAGHAVVFSNTLGFFPSPTGSNRGMRPGIAGVGNQGQGGGRPMPKR